MKSQPKYCFFKSSRFRKLRISPNILIANICKFVASITKKNLKKYLYIPNMPDPDIVIRTGGEIRISNFLLYQIAYSELFFVDVYFPEFRKIDFLRIIREYQKRERRFGK